MEKEKLNLEEILKIHKDIIRQISELDLKKFMIKEIRVIFNEDEYLQRVKSGEGTGGRGFCDSFYKRKLQKIEIPFLNLLN